MKRQFAMPDVGEGLTEAEIVTWNVAAGDTVTVNQILCEIETAKAAVELPSPFAGTIGELLVGPGETVAVGTPIVVIDTAEAEPAGGGRAAGGAAHAAGPVSGAGPSAAPNGEAAGAKIGEAGRGRPDRDAGGVRPTPRLGRPPPSAHLAAASGVAAG